MDGVTIFIFAALFVLLVWVLDAVSFQHSIAIRVNNLEGMMGELYDLQSAIEELRSQLQLLSHPVGQSYFLLVGYIVPTNEPVGDRR